MPEKSKNFQTIRRVDKLPLDVRLKLESKNIYDGLVIFTGTENSPKDILSEAQSFKLPSQLLDEAFSSSPK